MVVTYRNGAPVRVQDLGKAIDSVENTRVASWFNDKRAVILGVQRQPGANVVEVVDAIKEMLPTLRAQIPGSIKLDVFFDRTQSIRESTHDVQLTLIGTIVLVILVIFLFLRNVSATVIPSLALPMSIIGTFAVMYLLDYSLDNLSLMALTLAVGFVVDDAIVVLENIVRHMEEGEQPYRGGGQRRQGNRFYDCFHDDFVGRRLYPGAVHERHARATVARVLRYHLRGDPGFRVHLPELDADAVQPLSAAAARSRNMVGCTTSSAAASMR